MVVWSKSCILLLPWNERCNCLCERMHVATNVEIDPALIQQALLFYFGLLACSAGVSACGMLGVDTLPIRRVARWTRKFFPACTRKLNYIGIKITSSFLLLPSDLAGSFSGDKEPDEAVYGESIQETQSGAK